MIKLNTKIVEDLAKFIDMRYGIDISKNPDHPELMASFVRLQYWMDEVLLSRYFAHNDSAAEDGTYWKQQLAYDTRRTGKALKERLLKMNPNRVLDVGCGDNEWKKVLGGSLWGIDPYNDQADEKVGIMEFGKVDIGNFDVVLALGSINFGDDRTIFAQVEKVVACAKTGGKIFWRFNPGITHDNDHARWIDFYPWTEAKINEFAERLGCTVNEIAWDQTNEETIRWGNRYYSEWTKN